MTTSKAFKQHDSTFRFLQRPEGRIAYETCGSGPLVVCVPGMGDIRATFRHLAPALVDAGYRVAVMDLRGHGDSDATFSSYDDQAAADDLGALVWELGGPALVVGNSMGAAAAIVLAGAMPDVVSGLVLVGPFAREPKASPVTRAVMRAAMAPLWAARVWKAYLPSLYAGSRPDDYDAHLAAQLDAMRKPGYTKAFSRTTHTSHEPAEAAIPDVSAPALVVMGELDRDFPDPAAEAAWIAERLHADVLMVPDAGHYPHAQRPDVVNPAVQAFAQRVTADA